MHEALKELQAKRIELAKLAEDARRKTETVVAPALLYETLWQNSASSLSDLYHQRNSAGHDWWISVDRQTLEITAFDMTKGRDPVFKER